MAGRAVSPLFQSRPITGWVNGQPQYGPTPQQQQQQREQQQQQRSDTAYNQDQRAINYGLDAQGAQQQAGTTTAEVTRQMLANQNNPRSATYGGVTVQSGPSAMDLALEQGARQRADYLAKQKAQEDIRTAAEARSRSQQQQRIELAEENRRAAAFTALQGLLQQQTAAPAAAPSVPQVQAPAAPPPVSIQPRSSASSGPSLSFSRAKDASGRIGRRAVDALRDEFSSRGMSGGTLEGDAITDVITDTARYQSEAEAAALAAEAERDWEATQMEFEGNLAQRAQNIGVGETGYSGQVTQRGQDLDAAAMAARQRQEAMMALVSAFGRY